MDRVTRLWGEGRNGSSYLMSTKLFGDDENVLEQCECAYCH